MNTYYLEIDSPLHRLSPLSKFVAIMPLAIFVALTNDPWLPLAFILWSTAIIVWAGRVPWGRFLRLNLPLALTLCGFMLFYPFAIRPDLVANSPIWFSIGPVPVYERAVIYGLDVLLRTYALCLLSLGFTLTTDSSDFIRALVQQWRLPYKLGYGALAAFRFVPLLQDELHLIQSAHKVRGVSDKGGIRTFYSRMKRYTIPLLATAIRRAERTALAMDGRAFGVYAKRTYYKRFRFSAYDYLSVGLFWLCSIAIAVILWRLGLLGALSWDKQI